MPRLLSAKPLLLGCASASLAAHAVRMDAAMRSETMVRPGNGTAGRVAALLPLLAAVPGAEAFDLHTPMKGPLARAGGKPLKMVATDVDVVPFFGSPVKPAAVRERVVEASAPPDPPSEPPTEPPTLPPKKDDAELRVVTTATAQDKARAANELQCLSAFGGEHVVKLVRMRQEPDAMNLYLEKSDGNLREAVLAKQPSSIALHRRVLMLTEILRGLMTLDHARWVHRDIRPESVAVFGECDSEEGCRLKLTNLAHACSLDDWRKQSTGGTPLYMAPELWGSNQANEKIDVYAAGMLGFELFTGAVPEALAKRDEPTAKLHDHPFRTYVPKEFDLHEDSRFQKLRDEHPEVSKLLEGMLAKSPKDRFTVEEALLAALQAEGMARIDAAVAQQLAAYAASP